MKLLPAYFKWIGICTFLASIAFSILFWELTNKYKEQPMLIGTTKTITILSLLLIILAKEKIEDEFIQSCRERAAATAFITGVIAYVIAGLTTFFEEQGSTFQILGTEAFIYLTIFHLLKRNSSIVND
jgi:uncharacterized membrane protein YbhN (UPF0104 family)